MINFTIITIDTLGNELVMTVQVAKNGTPADIEILEGCESVSEEMLLESHIDEITEVMLAATGR